MARKYLLLVMLRTYAPEVQVSCAMVDVELVQMQEYLG